MQSRIQWKQKPQYIRDYCHYTGKFRDTAHNIPNLRYKKPKEIPVVLLNSSNYNYQFIIKELVDKFKVQSECLRENTEKFITFSTAI